MLTPTRHHRDPRPPTLPSCPPLSPFYPCVLGGEDAVALVTVQGVARWMLAADIPAFGVEFLDPAARNGDVTFIWAWGSSIPPGLSSLFLMPPTAVMRSDIVDGRTAERWVWALGEPVDPAELAHTPFSTAPLPIGGMVPVSVSPSRSYFAADLVAVYGGTVA